MFKHVLLIVILSAFFAASFALEKKIDAYVTVKFTTTVNVTTVPEYNENVGAVEMVFDMQEQLYNPVSALPEAITGFSIGGIKLSAPELSDSEDITASIRMAYKKTIQDTTVPLFYANSWSAATLKDGAALNSETGLSGFNTILQSDINDTIVSNRVFNKILFVIKIKLEGDDAASIDLNELNIQFELTANVRTKATVIDEE
jgi:hypothetical protein